MVGRVRARDDGKVARGDGKGPPLKPHLLVRGALLLGHPKHLPRAEGLKLRPQPADVLEEEEVGVEHLPHAQHAAMATVCTGRDDASGVHEARGRKRCARSTQCARGGRASWAWRLWRAR